MSFVLLRNDIVIWNQMIDTIAQININDQPQLQDITIL